MNIARASVETSKPAPALLWAEAGGQAKQGLVSRRTGTPGRGWNRRRNERRRALEVRR